MNTARFLLTAILSGLILTAPSVSIAGEGEGLVHPNPFKEGDLVHFTLSVPSPGSDVRVDLYDVRGAHIRRLLPLDSKEESVYVLGGEYDVPWDGSDKYGTPVVTGVYIAVLTANASIVKAVKVIKRAE